MLTEYDKHLNRDALEEAVLFEKTIEEQITLGFIKIDEVHNSIMIVNPQKSDEYYYAYRRNIMYTKTKEL